MKKILFVLTGFATGGIASSLINLINELSKVEKYKLTIFVFETKNLHRDIFPKNVEIIDGGQLTSVISLGNKDILKRNFFLELFRLFVGGIAKFYSQRLAYRIIFSQTHLDRRWDVAISFSHSSPKGHLYGGCNEFVLDKVIADKKVAFIHGDYCKSGIKSDYSRSVYSQFDKIAVVSDSVGVGVKKTEPTLAGKIQTVYNCHNIERILSLSNEPFTIPVNNKLNIVTVARFSEEKGHLRMLNVIKRLQQEGLFFVWHLAGDLNGFGLRVRKIVEDEGLQDCVRFYGDMRNPYALMKQCDLLLVPSYHEAAPMVFGEAEILHLPILTTDTISAKELVEDRGIGIVCENSEEGLYEFLKGILLEKINLEGYTDNMVFSNNLALSQFETLMK